MPDFLSGRSAVRALGVKAWMRAITALSIGLLSVSAAGPQSVPGPRAAPAIASVPAAPALTKADVDTWLDGFFPLALIQGENSGAVVVVVKDGKILTERGFGYADAATKRRVDPETTLFRPGSVSKLFAWTAVMQLVEQGKLNLDADINRYLDFRIPPYGGKPITLRNLMTHSAGFEEAIRDLITEGDAPKPLGTLLKRWTPERIFAPGDIQAYSNYGAALAGHIVERVSGEPFADYVEHRIFAPLGMTKSTFLQPLPARLAPSMARVYRPGSTTPVPFEIVGLSPAGGLSTTGSDMARFMIAHLDDGGAILAPDTAALMHRPQPYVLPGINQMALGFYTQDRNGRRILAHAGDTRVFHSLAWLFMRENVGIFVALNGTGRDGSGTVRLALFREFADRYFPGPAPQAARVDPATARRHAAMMQGTYMISRQPRSSFLRILTLLGQQRVTATPAGTLRLSADRSLSGAPREWVEIAPFLWRASDGEDLLAARMVDGEVERFSTIPTLTYLPVPWTMSTAWLSPALKLAFLIVLLNAIAWPAGAVARRVYGKPLELRGRDRAAFHATRGLSLLAVLAVLGWAYVFITGISNYAVFTGKMDGLIRCLQLVTPIAFFGLFALAAWNLWRAFATRRGWPVRIWSVVMLLSAAMAIWGGFVCHLFSLNQNF
jgi:CubicO group peptidase (beta-lactamase class C family)